MTSIYSGQGQLSAAAAVDGIIGGWGSGFSNNSFWSSNGGNGYFTVDLGSVRYTEDGRRTTS